jgi:hypothetical protein
LFGVRMMLATAIFAIIAAPAIGLELLVDKILKPYGMSDTILFGIIAAKYLIFVVDLLLFLVFVLREAWKSAGRLWE